MQEAVVEAFARLMAEIAGDADPVAASLAETAMEGACALLDLNADEMAGLDLIKISVSSSPSRADQSSLDVPQHLSFDEKIEVKI